MGKRIKRHGLCTKDGYHIGKSVSYAVASIILYVAMVLIWVTFAWDNAFKFGEPHIFDADKNMWPIISNATRLRFTVWLLMFLVIGVGGFLITWFIRKLGNGGVSDKLLTLHRKFSGFVLTGYFAFYTVYLQKCIVFPYYQLAVDVCQIIATFLTIVLAILSLSKVTALHSTAKQRGRRNRKEPRKGALKAKNVAKELQQNASPVSQKGKSKAARKTGVVEKWIVIISFLTTIISDALTLLSAIYLVSQNPTLKNVLTFFFADNPFVIRVPYDYVLILLPLVGFALLALNVKYNAPPAMGADPEDFNTNVLSIYSLASDTTQP